MKSRLAEFGELVDQVIAKYGDAEAKELLAATRKQNLAVGIESLKRLLAPLPSKSQATAPSVAAPAVPQVKPQTAAPAKVAPKGRTAAERIAEHHGEETNPILKKFSHLKQK